MWDNFVSHWESLTSVAQIVIIACSIFYVVVWVAIMQIMSRYDNPQSEKWNEDHINEELSKSIEEKYN